MRGSAADKSAIKLSGRGKKRRLRIEILISSQASCPGRPGGKNRQRQSSSGKAVSHSAHHLAHSAPAFIAAHHFHHLAHSLKLF